MKRQTLWSAVISCSLFTITPRGWTQSSTNPAAQQTSLEQRSHPRQLAGPNGAAAM
jgi:hypothetical protein